jgi:hypothetical protein
MAVALIIAGLIVDIWLLILVQRRGVRKHLPWFVLYVTWGVLIASVQLATWIISPRLYVAVYWWMELIAVILIVGAVRESFLRIFRGFTSEAWFHWSVWSVILAVVIYSAWKAIYAPPIQSSRLESFVYGAEFAFRWGIFGIAVLTAVLSVLVKEPMDRVRPLPIALGAGDNARPRCRSQPQPEPEHLELRRVRGFLPDRDDRPCGQDDIRFPVSWMDKAEEQKAARAESDEHSQQ